MTLDRSKRMAFEVERKRIVSGLRENFTFIWEPEMQAIQVFETSRQVGKKFFDEDKTENAFERFVDIYKQSLEASIWKGVFLGWVDPDTIEPLEE